MADETLSTRVDELLRLQQEREIYLSFAKQMREKIEKLDESARVVLLNEFDEAMDRIYMLSDDYRTQLALFKSSFARLYKDFHFTYLALLDEMKGVKEEE